MKQIDKSKRCSVCNTRPNWVKRAYCDSCGCMMCIGHATRVPNPLGFIARMLCPDCAKTINVWRPDNDLENLTGGLSLRHANGLPHELLEDARVLRQEAEKELSELQQQGVPKDSPQVNPQTLERLRAQGMIK